MRGVLRASVSGTSPQTSAPGDTRRRRLIGVDAARGLALISMMAIHILPSWTDNGEPTFIWTAFSGVSATLFALLAGLALAFMTGGTRPPHGPALTASRAALGVRAALIAVLGLLIAYVDPPASIILVYYGVMFLLAIPLLRLSVRALVGVAVGIAVLGPVMVHLTQNALPNLDGYDPTFTTLLTEPITFVSVVLFTGSFPVIPWMAYVCAGLAIGRLDLRNRRTGLRLFLTGTLIAVGAWLTSSLLQGPLGGRERLLAATPWSAREMTEFLTWGPPPDLPTTTWWWLTVLAPYTSTPFEVFHSLGIAVAVLGAMLLIARSARRMLHPLAAIGGMTLTLYCAHLLLLATGFLADAPWVSLIVQTMAAIAFAVVWLHFKGPGPLERGVSTAARIVRGRVETRLRGRTPG
ncbi:heparan-alpha-glucosaminide N-acetyltransferase domain-containing protein [Nesterenkonia sp. DZ6]|uniref:heparan-alpha-glucosaminide N-acetyltransferase domain-containing protein n=1 Tax=Nesterenkonia sp. DZ6 TaxID=2901229 RepID=UPI00351D5EFB